MKKLSLLFCCIVLSLTLKATHQRAGEITFRHISGLTYEATIVTYTYAPSTADRCALEINWGDGSIDTIGRVNGTSGYNPAGIPCSHLGEIVEGNPTIRRNVYVGVHTYAGNATYKISVLDPNRNNGVLNIPESVNVPFYVESQLIISPFIGVNNSPQLLLPPVDEGCVNLPYFHNPGAIDPDGDSLSYKLVPCKGLNGKNIPGYRYPNEVSSTPSTFKIDPVTGDISWENPTINGEYNIAFLIEEWRNGVRIGYVTRDMQIRIIDCQNHAPKLADLADTCVIAGETLEFTVSATDQDMDNMSIIATGSPFLLPQNKAEFSVTSNQPGLLTGEFKWSTLCTHIQKKSYQVYFKVNDNNAQINLSDLKTRNITVIGPPVENFSADPIGNSIQLEWNKYSCSNATGYKIYRRGGHSSFVPSPCETDVPASSGFHLITTLNSISDTSFLDDNSGNGLARGIDYCYRIVAIFPDGAASIASDEVCVQLKKDVPVITNVSILSTSETNGSVYVAWSKPTEIDASQMPGPYKYLIYRSYSLTGANPVLIDSLANLNDTIYTDILVNTETSPVSYRIDFYNDTLGNRFFIGSTALASSVFISSVSSDQFINLTFNLNVPWTNTKYVIYLKNDATLLFDSIATVTTNSFRHQPLVNNKEYCYYVKSIGSYNTAGIIDPIENLSQILCATPIDNVAPCPPTLKVTSDCQTYTNRLVWTEPDPDCAADVEKYRIYYATSSAAALTLIDSVNRPDTVFIHTGLSTILGCYAISAVDMAGNESPKTQSVCITSDPCLAFQLPNIFTPNNDGINDYFKAKKLSPGIEKIDLQILNRYGKIIWKTTDPNFQWDGKVMGTNQPAPDGAYFYVCDVYSTTSSGTVKTTIRGSVTILR